MPTQKQRRVMEESLKNKTTSISSIMPKVGYSKASAKNPSVVTKSKGWTELLEEYLPENLIAEIHHEQLRAERPVLVGGKAVMFKDNDARLKAVEYAYRLRGKYAAEQINITRRKYAEMSNEELVAAKAKAEKFLRKK